MKLRRSLLLASCLVCACASAPAQGTFQNLAFESAKLVPLSGGLYDFNQAFPGWAGYIAGVPTGVGDYNNLNLDGAGFSIIDSNYSNGLGLPSGLIQGMYTAVLMGGISGLNQPSDATLAQTSLVPVTAQSLQFKAQFVGFSPSASFNVTLDGTTLSLIPLASGTNYTLYGADISAWAGQTADLAFTAIAERPHFNADYLFLDAIQFSDQRTPEPGVLSLSFLGALVLGWRALRRRP